MKQVTLSPEALSLFNTNSNPSRFSVTQFSIKFNRYALLELGLKIGSRFIIEQKGKDFFIKITTDNGFTILGAIANYRNDVELCAKQQGLYEYLNLELNTENNRRMISFVVEKKESEGCFRLRCTTNFKKKEENEHLCPFINNEEQLNIQ